MSYKAIVIGASAGGFNALKSILPNLPKNYPLPILIVQHISSSSDGYMTKFLNSHSNVIVKEADEKESILPGYVYFAPPNYHLLIEENNTISLSNESKVNYSRPSIDVLFETASYAYGDELIGIILTGANSDGAKGLLSIKNSGGLCIVQNVKEADSPAMPESAIELAKPQKVLKIEEITNFLIKIGDEVNNLSSA